MKYYFGRMCVGVLISAFVGLGGMNMAHGADLSELQTATIQKLEGIEHKVDSVLEKVESRTINSELQENIQENQEEIEALVESQSEAIQQATSVEEIKEIVIDTAKRVILKTYDGVTDKDSLEESVNIEGSTQEKKEAVEVAKESMVRNGAYTVQLSTKGTYEAAMKRLRLFDSQIQGTLLFQDGIKTTLQIVLQEDSLLSQEVLSGLSEGEVPDGLIGFRVNKPEVYRIEAIDLGNEGLQSTRGVTEYATYNYREGMSKNIITVGVVDTGVDMQHPDLKNRISKGIRGYDFVNNDTDPTDDHYHGTHVAGTIAASHNGEGIIGVNPYVEIVPLKICTASGYCPSYAITNALKYAADQEIDILNMSLGGRGTVANNPTCDAIEYAVSKGVIPVVAAGNANSPVEYSIPGGCPQTITVGAYDSTQTRAQFSNYGAGVDVSAPGVDVYSTQPGGYKRTSGTSMATPHIAGLVSILLMQNSELTLQQIKQLLTSYPVQLQTESSKSIGVGVDVQALLTAQGLQTQEVTCNENACVFGDTQDTIQTEGESEESDGISVSAEVFEIDVGQTKALVIGGGEGNYRITKNNEGVGFMQVSQGVGIASAGETKEIQIEQGADEYIPREDDEQEELEDTLEEGSNDESELLNEYETQNEGQEVQLNEGLFNHEESVGIASSSTSTTINVLGLVPGETILTVTDGGGVKKTITVRVKETTFRMRPNQYSYLYPRDGREITRRGSHRYSRDLLDRFSYYRRGAYKISASRYAEGEGVMKRTIYNSYERKNQIMQWNLRVSLTKERLPLAIQGVNDVIELEVGDMRVLNVSGGVPRYSMSHSTNAVRLGVPRYVSSSYNVTMTTRRGIGIASADEGEEELLPTTVYEDDEDFDIENTGEENFENFENNENQENKDQDTQESEEVLEEVLEENFTGEELTFGQIQEPQEEQESQISIASAGTKHPVEIYAVNPGESAIQVVDARGETKMIQVIVKEKVEERRMGDRFKWYYRAHSRQPFHVAYVQSSNQDIIRTSYRRKNYYADIVQPGKAVITIGIASRKGGRAYTTMQFTVLARSDQPLSVSQEAITVPVGQRTDITLQGGLPKYTITKSNENVGLGNSNATQAIGVAGNGTQNKVVLDYTLDDQGTDEYSPTIDELPEQSQNTIPTIDGMEVEHEEEMIVDEEITTASSPAVQAKPNVLSIIGLSPGTSEVTVTDQLGDTKVIIVTVTEPEPQTIKTSLKLRFVESDHEYGERRDFLDQGPYHKAQRPYALERISSSSDRIYHPYFRSFRGRYGKGQLGGETILTKHIYLPLEKKQASYSYVVKVLGPTIEEVKENYRLWEIHKRENNGRRSSIGGGGGSDVGNSSSGENSNTHNSDSGDEEIDSDSEDSANTVNGDESDSEFSSDLIDIRPLDGVLEKSEVQVGDINILKIPIEEGRIPIIDIDEGSVVGINEELSIQSGKTCPIVVRRNGYAVKYQIECKDSQMEIPIFAAKEGDIIILIGSVPVEGLRESSYEKLDGLVFKKISYRSGTRLVRLPIFEKIELPFSEENKYRYLIQHIIDDPSIVQLANRNDGIEITGSKLGDTIWTMKVFDILKQEYIQIKFTIYIVKKFEVVPQKGNDFIEKLINSAKYMISINEDSSLNVASRTIKLYNEFYYHVQPNGPRDYKSNDYKGIKRIKLGLYDYAVDVPGNFAYGYAAAAGKIPYEIHVSGSFFAQLAIDSINGVKNLELNILSKTLTKESEDILWIVRGMLLYRMYGININSDILHKYLTDDLEILRNIDGELYNNALDNTIQIAGND